MITLSNGHSFEYMAASGALAFDGKGWPWERPLVRLGLIKPELFTIVIKSLTRHPRQGNLIWYNPWTWIPFSPWSCVRFIPGGVVNKVGLTNPGIDRWYREVGPKIDFKKYNIVGSIFGEQIELVEMAEMFNRFNFVAVEINVSCPNTGHLLDQAQMVIDSVKSVRAVSRHPIIVKVSVSQDYLAITRGLSGIAEAVSLNSVPWEIVFPYERSPLWRLEKKVGGGGGGVSGSPAQRHNWEAVELMAKQGYVPVIGPGVMEFEDMKKLRDLGAKSISFGGIHLGGPWKPTMFVKKEMKMKGE